VEKLLRQLRYYSQSNSPRGFREFIPGAEQEPGSSKVAMPESP